MMNTSKIKTDHILILDDILMATVNRAQEYLQNDLDVDKAEHSGEISRPKEPIIKDFTTLINVDGAVKGTFFMSVDQNLALRLVRKFIYKDIPSSELNLYVEDTMGEIFNIILGNTISRLSETRGQMKLDSPTTIETRTANLKFVAGNILAGDIETEEGSLSINVVA